MKRKRGYKKEKQKLLSSTPNIDPQDDEEDTDNAQLESPMEVQPSPSMGSADEMTPKQAEGLLTDNRPVGYGRVKVKLKSSKMLDQPRGYGDSQTQSDTDKTSTPLGMERQVKDWVGINMSTDVRKPGSIKIKSSRGLGSLSTIMNPNPNPNPTSSSHLPIQGERNPQTMYKQQYQRGHKFSHQDSRYIEHELNAALAVIKKIMKMDAAEPFNVPVNPDALGIPDYFDIIETPMDFGTICYNLEHGNKYKNSEDVFKDVQFIWGNCYKYNNKGDYIIELMKRVKKNFMKYWMQAGLYSDQANRTTGAVLGQDSGMELPAEDEHGKEEAFEAGGRMAESRLLRLESVGTPSFNGSGSIRVETLAPASHERMHVKSTYPKQKTRRRHGINKHKSGCLCAVCVVRRRRQEREGQALIVKRQTEVSSGNMTQEFRQEEISENPGSENASSNSDCSPNPDADAEFEDQDLGGKLGRPEKKEGFQQEKKRREAEMEIQKTVKKESSEQASGDAPNPHSRCEEMENSGFMTHLNDQEGQELSEKQNELGERQKQSKMCRNLFSEESPSIVHLCGTLFSNDGNSLWGGPHSLVRREVPVRKSSAMHDAVASFFVK